MGRHNLLDMGAVTNLSVVKKPGRSEALLLIGRSAHNRRWIRVITQGAAQALWFHLTHILFPRAAQQVTPRAATALFRKSDSPAITTMFEVFFREEEGSIYVRGLGSEQEWVIRFTLDEGHELWASLEKTLKSVTERGSTDH